MKDRFSGLSAKDKLARVGTVFLAGALATSCGDFKPSPPAYLGDNNVLTVKDESTVLLDSPEFDCYSNDEIVKDGSGIQGQSTRISLHDADCVNGAASKFFEHVVNLPPGHYQDLVFNTDYQVTLVEQ